MTTYHHHATIAVTCKTWQEERIAETDAVHAVARATFTTEYAGDLTGSSTCGLLICYRDGDPADPHSLVGPYSGYEHVTGTLAGRSGSFVLAVRGEHSGGVAETEVEVVPGSATGALAGLRGSGSYAAGAMTYTMDLDYEVEPGEGS